MPLSPPGVNLIGHVSANFGLGIAARSTVARLRGWRHPVAVIDVEPNRERTRRGAPGGASLEDIRVCPHPINVFHMNPIDAIIGQKLWYSRISLRSANVCIPFWELPHLPRNWLPVLAAMDVLMAPTQFVRAAIERGLGNVPVLSYPQVVTLPEGVRAERSRWGIAEGVVAFLVSFDPWSDIQRKNPLGAIEAFRRAFSSDEKVALLIKVNRPEGRSDADFPGGAHLAELKAAAVHDRRIRFIETCLPYAEVLSLCASADVLVSLHRGEGLGLHLMEAMTLGKPVIATGWSGNRDYMTAENSCLVGYSLVRVRSDHPTYAAEAVRPEQVWAEPDVDAAAAWMRQLFCSSALRSALGERAAQAMRDWAVTANATSPFLDIEAAVAQNRSLALVRRRMGLVRLVWSRRSSRLFRRWKRRAGSALGI